MMNKKALAALILAMGFTAGSASAKEIVLSTNFDDINTAGSATGVGINNGYAGVNWDNFNVINGNAIPGSGYQTGIVSQSNVAFNGWGPAATISSTPGNTFELYNAYFTATWNSDLVTAVGNNGAHTMTFAVNPSGPVLIHFDWTGLTSVTFTSNSSSQFVVDNFSTPLPAAIWLALSGLAGIVPFVRRRMS